MQLTTRQKALQAQLQRQRTKRAPGVQPSKGIIVRYLRFVLSLISEFERMIYRIIDEESDTIFVGDSVGAVLQDYLPKKVSQRIDVTTKNYVFYLEPKVKSHVSQTVQKINRHHKEEFVKNIEASTNVDILPLIKNDDLSALVKTKVDDNVRLIKSLPEQYAEKAKNILGESLKERDFVKAIEELEHLGAVTRSRAKLIVRDQVEKINSAMNQERQTNIGVTHYFWRTVGDDRVRTEHRDRNNDRFAWDDPPFDGHPGEAVNCRCIADPDLSTVEI